MKTIWFTLQVTSITEGNITKIIWYNPPFDLQFKANIGKTFLQLLGRNFPPHHRLHKIINRNTVKISYLCMPNMTSHISSHHKSIIQESKNSHHLNPKSCDCQIAENCPLNGNCKQSAVIYQADVTPEIDNEHTCIGLTEGPFKERLMMALLLSMNNTNINLKYLPLSGT